MSKKNNNKSSEFFKTNSKPQQWQTVGVLSDFGPNRLKEKGSKFLINISDRLRNLFPISSQSKESILKKENIKDISNDWTAEQMEDREVEIRKHKSIERTIKVFRVPTSPFPTFSSEIDNSTPVTEPSDGGGADGYSPSSHIRQLIRDLGSEPKLIKSSTECIRPMDLYKNRSIHNIHEHERVQCARAKQVFDPTVLGANEREFTRYKLAHITKTYIPSGMHHETIDEVKMHRRWPLKRKCIEMPGNCGVCSAVKILLFIMLLISIGLVLYDPCFWIIFKQDTNHTVGYHSSKSTKTTTTTMTITPKLKAINEINAKNHNVTRSTSIPKHLIQEKHKNCGFKIYAIVLASFGVLLLFITFIAYTFHLVITYNRFSWFLAEAIICSVYYIALFATSIGSYIFGNQISGTFFLLISIIGFVTSVWIYGYYSSDVTPWLVVTTPDPDMDELAQIMGRRQFSKLFQFGKQMSDITLHQQMSNTNILKKVVDKIHPQKTLNSFKTKR